MSAGFEIAARDFDAHEATIRALRGEVFTAEQGIDAAIDFDGSDLGCIHVIAYASGGDPIGTARMLPDGHIGRIAVRRPWRGRGVGTALTRALVARAAALGHASAYLDSQAGAVGFYERLGFVEDGERFLEAGIEHVRMRIAL